MPNLITLDDHSLSVVDAFNKTWVTSIELAKQLGYKRSDQVTRLYKEHSDEFTETMSQVIDLSENTETVLPRRVRVFSLRGAHLIAMFSKTETAKKFRRWLLDVIESINETGKYELPKPERLTPAQQRHIQNRVAQLVREQVGTTYKMIWAQIKNHFKVGSYKDIPAARYPDVCAYLKCQPIFLSKTEDEQLFLDDLSAEHSAELKKALESQGIERLLVVIEKGRLALVKNIQGFSIVDAQGYRTVRRNMQMLNKQFNWLSGDEGMESLDLEFENLH